MLALSVLALVLTAQPSRDTVYRVGGGVSAPRLIYRAEPEYTHAARDANVQGDVVLSAVIDPNGSTRDLKIVRGLGFGLDEAALESVSEWLFRPGTKDGKPVPVAASIVVNFRLVSPAHQVSAQVCGGTPRMSSGQAIQTLADHGNANAQYVMGCSAFRGVPPDYVLAHMWFNLAATQGLQKAALARDAVAQKMTLQQMSEAKARARAWKPNK